MEDAMKDKASVILMVVLTVAAVGQILAAVTLHARDGDELLTNVGWLVMMLSAIFGWLPIYTLRKKGGVPEGKSYVHTTALVDTGIYGIVRHPQYLAGVLISVALPLIAQHWLVAVLGAVAIVVYFVDAAQEDQRCIDKFGDSYRAYMATVPQMNFVLGIARAIRQRTGAG
jgi:protein-S-isoprenylcysteine O-methyltransferase Ste14